MEITTSERALLGLFIAKLHRIDPDVLVVCLFMHSVVFQTLYTLIIDCIFKFCLYNDCKSTLRVSYTEGVGWGELYQGGWGWSELTPRGGRRYSGLFMTWRCKEANLLEPKIKSPMAQNINQKSILLCTKTLKN